jgi:hypothetical protein
VNKSKNVLPEHNQKIFYQLMDSGFPAPLAEDPVPWHIGG